MTGASLHRNLHRRPHRGRAPSPAGGWVLDTATLTGVLAGGWLVLLAASATTSTLYVVRPQLPVIGMAHRLLSVQAETNVPKLYSLLLALVCGVLAAGAGFRLRRTHGFWHAALWWAVAALMALLAAEDFLQLHDTLVRLVTDRIAPWRASAGAWVAGAFVTVGVLAVALLLVLWRLPRHTRWLLVVAASTIGSGTVGLETLGAFLYTRPAGPGLAWLLVSTAEEFVEMAGVIVLLHAVVSHLRTVAGGTRVRLELLPD